MTLKETAEHGLSSLLGQGSLPFSGRSPGKWLPKVVLTVLWSRDGLKELGRSMQAWKD